MILQLADITLELLAEKALFLPGENILVVADLHLGKATHFRRSGIPLPMQGIMRDYERLHRLIAEKQPERIILLGDLFHSRYNSEWQLFCDFVNTYPRIRFTLIIGNHDILDRAHYEKLCLEIMDDRLLLGNLLLTHEPLKAVPQGRINIAGHIHPGVRLYGAALQSVKLPCFYLRPQQLILPAFGSLTGLYLMEKGNAEVFVIVKEKVIRISNPY